MARLSKISILWGFKKSERVFCIWFFWEAVQNIFRAGILCTDLYFFRIDSRRRRLENKLFFILTRCSREWDWTRDWIGRVKVLLIRIRIVFWIRHIKRPCAKILPKLYKKFTLSAFMDRQSKSFFWSRSSSMNFFCP